ncbi:hypothetical protein NDN08_002442 [Rhodosorus marinus]|uniref:Probable ATP-dependent transporter ycf16 n=1 Tax=Rhodosorus marinus TaxID=101924 RepID=A0AAV8UWJ6_9RHOD|nr:hypothetical protein NDN08_002442 [Rhodosorus marinus]
MAELGFIPGGLAGTRLSRERSFCQRDRWQMGLNASKAKKSKGGKKGKGGKGGNSGPGDKPRAAPKGNSKIDTDKREYVFQMYKLGKSLPNGKELLKNINLSFFPGAKIGVLGNNGAGKSTLIKIMAGIDNDFVGEALPQTGLKLAYLAQEPDLKNGETVGENVEAAVTDIRASLNMYKELSEKMASSDISDEKMLKLSSELESVQSVIEAKNGWELDRVVDRALDALRCPPSDAKVDVLSGGERRRVALAALLINQPDMLILDEPTNHLDAESVSWLETYLGTFQGTIVAVTHDRYFLDNVAEWILELDRGRGIPFEGNYSGWLDLKAKRLAQEEKESSARTRALKSELEWVQKNPKGQQVKSKARMERFNRLQSEDTRARDDMRAPPTNIYIPPGPKLGDQVVEAENLRKVFGDRVLIDNLSFSLPKGAIVGIIGGNGAGKSTLFKMLMQMEQPDGGSLKIGESVNFMYVDQSREGLDAEKTVFEEVTNNDDEIMLGTRTVNSRAYLGWFNFKGGDQQKKVGNLSGGERNRINLAKVLKQGGNVLLLDEPTNDLDVDTLRALEEAVLDFGGCAMVISHDRWFLDRVATHILAFEGDSEVRWFDGNYSEYEQDRVKRLGSVEPTRVKYRPIPAIQ